MAQYQRTGTADKPYCMSGNRTDGGKPA